MNLMHNPLTMIPAEVRQYIYMFYALILLGWGAVEILYDPDPLWVTRGGDVLQYLGIMLGFTAASNVTPNDLTPEDYVAKHKRDEAGTSEVGLLLIVLVVVILLVVLLPRL